MTEIAISAFFSDDLESDQPSIFLTPQKCIPCLSAPATPKKRSLFCNEKLPMSPVTPSSKKPHVVKELDVISRTEADWARCPLTLQTSETYAMTSDFVCVECKHWQATVQACVCGWASVCKACSLDLYIESRMLDFCCPKCNQLILFASISPTKTEYRAIGREFEKCTAQLDTFIYGYSRTIRIIMRPRAEAVRQELKAALDKLLNE